jgi:hypothetical protein
MEYHSPDEVCNPSDRCSVHLKSVLAARVAVTRQDEWRSVREGVERLFSASQASEFNGISSAEKGVLSIEILGGGTLRGGALCAN